MFIFTLILTFTLLRSIVPLFYVHHFLDGALWIVLIWLTLVYLTFVCFVQSLDNNTINEAIEDITFGICVVKEHASSDEVQDIGIVLEGINAIQDLDNLTLGVAMLFGLMYVLNLSYPTDLRNTFEVIQKFWMELDGGKLSNKALALKNRLPQWTGHTDITVPFFWCYFSMTSRCRVYYFLFANLLWFVIHVKWCSQTVMVIFFFFYEH